MIVALRFAVDCIARSLCAKRDSFCCLSISRVVSTSILTLKKGNVIYG